MQLKHHSESKASGYSNDLSVEVIFLTDRDRDLRIEVANYQAAGAILWGVNRDTKTVEVYLPNEPVTIMTASDVLSFDRVLPDFSLKVGDIFPSQAETPAE